MFISIFDTNKVFLHFFLFHQSNIRGTVLFYYTEIQWQYKYNTKIQIQTNNMTSNMFILLAGLWTRKKILTNTVAADVAGTDAVQ